jgi:DNA-binding beta-propeller fold protein YncE/glyoxylase-like metal-dependent hydrolase (beta-lactamase superfamily II)
MKRHIVPAQSVFEAASVAALLAAAAAPPERLAAQQTDFSQVRIATVDLGSGLYMLKGQGGNLGLSVGADGAFLVDDQFAPLTEKIQAAVAAVSQDPVRWVLNTHWHGDHTGGNENLGKAGAFIVAHANVRRRMNPEEFKGLLGNVQQAPPKALPVVTFDEGLTFHWNGEAIDVFHVDPAHTDGDAVVVFTKADVIHMGDLFFNGRYPFVDMASGGNLNGLIAAAERVLRMIRPTTKLIPGHGELAGRTELQAYRDMLVTVRQRVQALITQGMSEDQVVAAKPTQDLDATWGTSSERFVRAAYQSLRPVPGLEGTLVITNKTPGTATLVDAGSGRTLATLPTGAGPHEAVLSRDGSVAVVTDYGAQPGGSTLTVIDVPGLRVARTISLGEYTRPHGIAFLPGDSLVAVTSEASRNVVLVNVAAGAVRGAIPTQHNGSHMLGVVADGSRIYTGDIGSHTVSQLNVRTRAYVQSWTVPEQPEAINVTPDGTEVWVGSNATGKVTVVDPRTGAVTTALEGFGWPYRIHFTPDVSTVLLPDMRREELRIVERASRRELARLPFTGAGPQGITTTPDGKFALLSLSRQARVAVIELAGRKVVAHFDAGDTPDGIAYTPRVVAR